MMLHKLALCGIIAGRITTSSAWNVDDLDAAILQDILEAYTDHQPSSCTGDAASSTSYTYDFPGTNPDSNWHEEFVQYEEDLFLAAMTHTDDNNRSWTIRLGQGGNMYSHFCPDLHGESTPPQAHISAPWIDEVHQSVSANENLNMQEGECNGDTCPAYYIHGAGTYQGDVDYTSTTPFYSQSLAKHCDGATCTFAAWAQQAHLTTIFTSPIITLNRFTNCGDGIIEHTEMIYNFAPAGSVPNLIDQTYFNVPWSGVRASNLPFALEPDPTTDELSYEDPDTVDYCPLCGWGNNHDKPGGPQGRCAKADLQDLGGYTSFVGHGLYVNRPADEQKPYLWCSKPAPNCDVDATSCMATPDDCYDDGGQPFAGYTPVILEVPANSSPQCADRGSFHNGYELKCKMRRVGFGHSNPNLSATAANDPCAPWAGTDTKMGFYRSDTNEGFEVTFIRHWSWSPSDEFMYFRVNASNFAEAEDMVHSAFDNTGNIEVLPIQFQVTPPATSGVPADYNPGALPSVTFVAGDGISSLPGDFRRRIGSSNRDYYVYTNNYWGTQARLEDGYALSKRAFFFASELSSVKATADSLKSKVVYDLIEDTRYNPRAIDIYKAGASFDAVAATSAQGTSTTCTSPSATLECSGFSTPKPGYSPIFYVTCGSSRYLGPDPYFFTPGNGENFTFPGMSNNNDEKIRSYACEGEATFVRPTWKLIGFFDSTCVALGPGLTYDDEICVEPSAEPSSQPSSKPSLQPSSELSSQPSLTISSQPSIEPSSQPSSAPSLQLSSAPSSQPSLTISSRPSVELSSQPSSKPSLQHSSEPSSSLKPSPSPSNVPSPAPEPVKKWVWCSKPGGCSRSNEASCMATPSECYTEDGYGSPKPGYTPIELFVAAGTHPQCRDRYLAPTSDGYEIRCKFHTAGFGRTKPYLRPPSGSTMGLYREDTGEGFEITFLRHWSWRSHANYVYLRVKASNFRAARNIVHNAMNNVGNDQRLPVRFEMRSLFE